MKKIIYSTLIMIAVLFTVSVCVYASNDNLYSNGTDIYSNGVAEFYSNIDDEDKLYKLSLSDMTEEKIMDEHIISMVNKGDFLYLLVYANGKSNLLKFDINDDIYFIEKEFESVVTNIAIRDNILYYVESRNIFTYNVDTKENSIFIKNDITDFFVFTDYNTLKYYTKGDEISEYSENTYSFEGIEPIRAGYANYGISLMSVSSYSPRLTAPAEDNAYYTSLNIFHTSGFGMVGNNGNCTCYAYGRSYENLASKPKLCTKNAENWYKYNKDNGYYSYGLTPALGAVAVWSRGVIGDNSDGAGHVAVVEVINGDTVTTSESGWESYYFKTVTRSASNSNFSQASKYTFEGFIYVCGTNSVPEEPETGHTHSYWRSVEAVHPHREYMVCSCGDYYYTGNNGYYLTYEGAHAHREYYVCEVESCELNRTYTGNYGTEITWEGSHPHREYYNCEVASCELNRTYTGNYGSTTKYESTYPYKEYYVCKVTSCSYHNTYTGNNAIPQKPSFKNLSNSYYINDTITFSWNSTTNTTHYNIYVDKINGSTNERIDTIHYATSGTTRTYESGQYRVLLQSTNSNFAEEDGTGWLYTNSDWVYFTVKDLPSAPTNVTAKTSGSKVTVSWSASTNATSYDVYLVQSPWAWADIKYSKSTTSTSYTFTNVANGEYKAFVIARPNKDTAQSSWVALTVKNVAPQFAYISTSKDNYKVNESITFSFNTDASSGKNVLWIYYPDGTSKSYTDLYDTYTVSLDKEGNYEALVQAWNSVGSKISERIKFSVGQYQVLYDSNGGENAPSSQTKAFGKSLTLSSDIPKRTGYVFKNWNTKADGSGTAYSSGGSYTADAATTLYAQWTTDIPHTLSTVTKSNAMHTLTTEVYRIKTGINILAVGYKNGKMIDFDKKEYAGVDLNFNLTGDIDEIKVIVWNSLSGLVPLCEAEIIPQSEWIVE